MKFEDMLIVLLIVVILFGGSKIPQLGAGLGKGIRSFKDAMEGKGDEATSATSSEMVQEPPADKQPKS